MKWFEKWRKYTGFNLEALQKPKNRKSSTDSSDELLKEEPEGPNPGPINSDDILDKEAEILADPDIVKDYCNYVIKQGLVENKEFIIVAHPVWKYLYNIYKGQNIKRYVISVSDETDQTTIEIWLKKVSLYF